MGLTGACEVCEMCLIYSTESLLYLCSGQVLISFFFGMYLYIPFVFGWKTFPLSTITEILENEYESELFN